MPEGNYPEEARAVWNSIFQLWPRWKTAIITASYSTTRVDATFNNNGGTGLFGGWSGSVSGSISFARWTGEAPRDLGPTNGGAGGWGAAFSHGCTDGKLYTYSGGIYVPEDDVFTGSYITTPDLAEFAMEWRPGVDWAVYPDLEPGYESDPPGAALLRGRADGMLVRFLQVGAVTGGHGMPYDVDETFDNGSGTTGTRNGSGFGPVDRDMLEFGLGAAFSGTLTTITDFSPPDDDPEAIPAYYPTRGTLTDTITASFTIEFEE